MRKRTLPGEVNYSFYRDKEGLQIVNNNPARGTENRHHTESKDPHSSLASKSLSTPALMLRRARQDDIKAYEWLIDHMTPMILSLSKVQGWKIKTTGKDIARCALAKYIQIEGDKQINKADICGVKPPAYSECWKPKVNEVEIWVKGWDRELSG